MSGSRAEPRPGRQTADPKANAQVRSTRLRLPLLQGVLPVSRPELPGDLLAGVTLAALGIPEVLGYAKIAGMPVVTGLYTILLPIAVFAVLGSSRHLVVGADSATAAILAAGLVGLATAGSGQYVQLAALAALLTGALLLLARLIRLGFLANFLSRTVLIGFLTGVGVQVAAGQVGEMLGINTTGHGTLGKLIADAQAVRQVNGPTVVVSLIVIALVVGVRKVTRRVPGALIAVVGAIVAGKAAHLSAHGVRVLGAVPRGLPHLGLPTMSLSASAALAGTSVSMFVVILAQSSATSRAYAARYDEAFSENTDLVGLGVANVAAAVTGTFVVNGSPTKTQMVDSAGGRSQLSQLTTAVVVLVVLLFLTGPLAYLPLAVLATIVFLIGIELIDLKGMARILAVRREEFLVALLTTAAVVFIGIEQGIILAIVASIVDHLRHSYAPRSLVLVPAGTTPTGGQHWKQIPAAPGVRSAPGVVILRFDSSIYYANAQRLLQETTDLTAPTGGTGPAADPDTDPGAGAVRWFCLDAAAVGDIDFTGADVLRRAHTQLNKQGVRLVFSEVADPVRAEIDRYGITDLVGPDAYYQSPADVLAAFADQTTANKTGSASTHTRP